MKIMTVRQPWALHIIQSGKDVENRVRNMAGTYRGPVAIHAGLSLDAPAMRNLPGLPPNGVPRVFEIGHIIGVVDLVDVHHADTCRGTLDEARRHEALKATRDPKLSEHWHERYCSPWAEPDRQHLVLKKPRPLTRLIKYRGALGLRQLDALTIRQIEEALA